MTAHHGQKRDANEREIVVALRAAGCSVTQMDAKAGFDLLVISPLAGVLVMEIKDGAKPPSARYLTPNEHAKRDEIEAAGGVYNVAETVEQALRIAGR